MANTSYSLFFKIWSRSSLHHLCKQKGKGVACIPPTPSTELEMFWAPTSLKEYLCPATLHSLILLQQGEWKMDNITSLLSLAVDSDISFRGAIMGRKIAASLLQMSWFPIHGIWSLIQVTTYFLTGIQTSCISITPVQSSTVKDTSLPCPSMEIHSYDKSWNCETCWEFSVVIKIEDGPLNFAFNIIMWALQLVWFQVSFFPSHISWRIGKLPFDLLPWVV